MKITKQLVILLFATILLQGQPLRAQQPDSTAIDSLTYNIFKALPEVMVKGERPVVKAKKGMLEYDMMGHHNLLVLQILQSGILHFHLIYS